MGRNDDAHAAHAQYAIDPVFGHEHVPDADPGNEFAIGQALLLISVDGGRDSGRRRAQPGMTVPGGAAGVKTVPGAGSAGVGVGVVGVAVGSRSG
jgi:hypothetical protein